VQIVDIIYNPNKAEWLLKVRNIDMKEVEEIIYNEQYLAIRESKSRPGQKMFIIRYKNYAYVVPYVVDDGGSYVIKTVYPCRKYNKIYGGAK
jgi:hypothetical protein